MKMEANSISKNRSARENFFKLLLSIFLVSSLNSYGQDDYWSENYRIVSSKSFKDGKITLTKKVDKNDYLKNPDGSPYYKTTFAVDLEYNNQTVTSIIDSVLYTSANYDVGMMPCMLIDENQKVIFFFSNSKTGTNYYTDGFVYSMEMNANHWEKETIFTNANHGWYSFFGGNDNGNPELWHFSFEGRNSMLSKRTAPGYWNTQNMGTINPGWVRERHPSRQNILIASVSGVDRMTSEIEEFKNLLYPLEERAYELAEKKDYRAAEKLSNEAITLFSRMSKEEQNDWKELNGGLHYNLACYLSMQNKKKLAVDAFQEAVMYGWINYSHAKTDTDLDNIRTDKRFVELMETIRKQSDYIYILRQAGKYQRADTTGLSRFTYEAATSSNLRAVKQYFKLDSIAGQGDDISKVIKMMTWIHDNIRHDGNNSALCEFDAIDIYNYHKSTGKGVNCRHLAIALNEMYLAMGFKSRYVTCLPTNENDQDCHVINSVYVNSLKKWIWIDPTFNAYVKDEDGNLLNIEEVRERLIDDRPLVLNEDANWNNISKQTKERYLDSYMAKNLFWLQCPSDSRFNPESRYRNTNQTYISLRPLGDERSSGSKEVITHDATYFWEH